MYTYINILYDPVLLQHEMMMKRYEMGYKRSPGSCPGASLKFRRDIGTKPSLIYAEKALPIFCEETYIKGGIGRYDSQGPTRKDFAAGWRHCHVHTP